MKWVLIFIMVNYYSANTVVAEFDTQQFCIDAFNNLWANSENHSAIGSNPKRLGGCYPQGTVAVGAE